MIRSCYVLAIRSRFLLTTREDGEVDCELHEFGGFKRDRRALAEWVKSLQPEQVVMESSGIYWKSPYAALEQIGIIPLVVNARHVKNVPGRKTDAAARTRCSLQERFKAWSLRRSRKRAIIALAHKLLRIVYVWISQRECYRDTTIDYEAQMVARNAPRWFKMLKKHGFLTA